jgi:hypothetical protein
MNRRALGASGVRVAPIALPASHRTSIAWKSRIGWAQQACRLAGGRRAYAEYRSDVTTPGPSTRRRRRDRGSRRPGRRPGASRPPPRARPGGPPRASRSRRRPEARRNSTPRTAGRSAERTIGSGSLAQGLAAAVGFRVDHLVGLQPNAIVAAAPRPPPVKYRPVNGYVPPHRTPRFCSIGSPISPVHAPFLVGDVDRRICDRGRDRPAETRSGSLSAASGALPGGVAQPRRITVRMLTYRR